MNDRDDDLILRALDAWKPMYHAVQAFAAWTAHWEQCEDGCRTGDDGVADADAQCQYGYDLRDAAHDLNRRAVAACACDCDDAEEPSALLGQPWRAPAEVA